MSDLTKHASRKNKQKQHYCLEVCKKSFKSTIILVLTSVNIKIYTCLQFYQVYLFSCSIMQSSANEATYREYTHLFFQFLQSLHTSKYPFNCHSLEVCCSFFSWDGKDMTHLTLAHIGSQFPACIGWVRADHA